MGKSYNKTTMTRKTMKGGVGFTVPKFTMPKVNFGIKDALLEAKYLYLKKPKLVKMDDEKSIDMIGILMDLPEEKLIAAFPKEEDQLTVFEQYELYVIEYLIKFLNSKITPSPENPSPTPLPQELVTIKTNLEKVKKQKTAIVENQKLQAAKDKFNEENPGYNEFDFVLEMFEIFRLKFPDDNRYAETPDKQRYDSDETYRHYIQELIIEKYIIMLKIVSDTYFTNEQYRNEINVKIRNRVYIEEVQRYLKPYMLDPTRVISSKKTPPFQQTNRDGKVTLRVFADGNWDPNVYKQRKDAIINRLKILHKRDAAIKLIAEINELRRKIGSTGRVGESASVQQSDLGAWQSWGAQLIGTSTIELEKIDEPSFFSLDDAKTYVELLTKKRDELKSKLQATTPQTTPQPPPQTMPQQFVGPPPQTMPQQAALAVAGGGSKKRKNKKAAKKTKTQKKSK